MVHTPPKPSNNRPQEGSQSGFMQNCLAMLEFRYRYYLQIIVSFLCQCDVTWEEGVWPPCSSPQLSGNIPKEFKRIQFKVVKFKVTVW